MTESDRSALPLNGRSPGTLAKEPGRGGVSPGVGARPPPRVLAFRCYGSSSSRFITLTFDRAKGKKKVKREMQWQLTNFSSLKDFVDLPEESWISTLWLLIGTAVWTLQNQIKYNLVYVILGLRRQGKIISLLQLITASRTVEWWAAEISNVF